MSKYVCIFCVIFFQCAYFNTFYIAEKSFEKAIQIVEKAPILDDDKIPSEASDLLDKTILNCNVVIDKYPNSKYVYEAYLLNGIAFFYKNLYDSSIQSFDRIINTPNEKQQIKINLWYAYSLLRLADIESSIQYLSLISFDELEREDKYIYYNIQAELNEVEGNIEAAYSNYIEASNITRFKTRKIYIYRKLIKISQDSEDLFSQAKYLNLLEQNINDINERKSIKIEWVETKQKLGHYGEIISTIDEIINDPDFQSIRSKLMLYKVKAYKNNNKLGLAKEILNDITLEYSKKDETAEAYFILGSMSLFEDFNIEESKEYFQKSVDEKSRSKFGKKSKLIKEKIEDYENMLDDYFYFKDNISIDTSYVENSEINDMNMSLPVTEGEILIDSILFDIGQILYFDFNQQDSAISHYNYLLKEFPETKYKEQLLDILAFYKNPNLKTDFDQSSFNAIKDTLEENRDEAVNIEEIKPRIEFYSSLYDTYQDSIALFNIAYMKDRFQYEILDAIEIYQKINEDFPKHPKNDYINERLSDIENDVITMIKENNIKIDFSSAFDFIEISDFDSAKFLLEEIEIGRKDPLYKSVNQLIKKINNYVDLKTQDSASVNKDSIIFKMAEIEYYFFNQSDKSFEKFKNIVTDFSESQYKNQSLWVLLTYFDQDDSLYQDSINYELVDTNVVDFYNPINNWDKNELIKDNKKLERIYSKFEDSTN